MTINYWPNKKSQSKFGLRNHLKNPHIKKPKKAILISKDFQGQELSKNSISFVKVKNNKRKII